ARGCTSTPVISADGSTRLTPCRETATTAVAGITTMAGSDLTDTAPCTPATAAIERSPRIVGRCSGSVGPGHRPAPFRRNLATAPRAPAATWPRPARHDDRPAA